MLGTKVQSKTICMPPEIWELIDDIANETGLSRSYLLTISLVNNFGLKRINKKWKPTKNVLKHAIKTAL